MLLSRTFASAFFDHQNAPRRDARDSSDVPPEHPGDDSCARRPSPSPCAQRSTPEIVDESRRFVSHRNSEHAPPNISATERVSSCTRTPSRSRRHLLLLSHRRSVPFDLRLNWHGGRLFKRRVHEDVSSSLRRRSSDNLGSRPRDLSVARHRFQSEANQPIRAAIISVFVPTSCSAMRRGDDVASGAFRFAFGRAAFY